MEDKRPFFILSGERSGDIHGALLMKAMKKENPHCSFIGIGGDAMEAEGLTSLFPLEKMSIMGFVEVLKHLSFFKNVEREVLTQIKEQNPQRIILIDYPGFNLRLAEKVKKQFNIPITYYISPQIWAWKEKRIEKIRQFVNQMLVIFPFEKQWYEDRGVNVEWVGHPYVEEWEKKDKSTLKETLGLDKDKLLLTLFPGSRKQELSSHLDLCIKSATQIIENNNDVQVALGLSKNLNLDGFHIPNFVHVEREHPRRVLEAADVAIVASGTSTLEATIYGTPLVVIYKMNPISWYLSKKMVTTSYAAMPNIIANRRIVPELLQKQAKVAHVVEQVERIMRPSLARDNMLNNLTDVRVSLGDGMASTHAAKLILGAS